MGYKNKNRPAQAKLHRTELFPLYNFKQQGPQRVLHNAGQEKKHHNLIIVEISPGRLPPGSQAQVVNI